ncbi:hypothetical protein BDU57DRAFT_551964 [Ampelomyces quisqualis]|uniref:MYND-type domain-containing protein n=1 Tax=Ampelomyces quisqualis TaxID=50730 RepID=A0A6A5Q806_AMPQU|nr:hypothetical protein BDU57DRAFT_551964 [Ampelomyces quisqualis]
MSTPLTPEPLCAMCPSPAPHQCKSCQSIRYCSTRCQKIDWSVHKLVCKAHKDINMSPGPNHVRALYFPENGTGPLFVWVRVKVEQVDCLRVDVSILGITEDRKTKLQEWRGFTFNKFLRRPIPDITWIGSFYQDAAVSHLSSVQNTSLCAIDEELADIMFGPLIFYSPTRDLNPTDFRTIVDMLRWDYYSRWHIRGPPQQFSLATVPSVMVNCWGDVHFCHQPDCAPIPLPKMALEPDCPRTIALPIGDLVGIPLVGVKAMPSLPWRDRAFQSPGGIGTSSNRGIFGMQPSIGEDPVGSVMVARKDGKMIDKVHVLALNRYCRSVTKDMEMDNLHEFQETEIGELGMWRWECLKAKESEEGFRAFWEEFKMTKDGEGVVSPYDV